MNLMRKSKSQRQQLLEIARGPKLPQGVDYLLLTSLASTAKPWAFPSIDALARSLHRRRDGRALYLVDTLITPWMATTPITVVCVYTREIDETQRHLGWAYLAGGDRRRLSEALLREMAEAGPRSEEA
jgi:hypothetical protein